jgi:hypothetical protein
MRMAAVLALMLMLMPILAAAPAPASVQSAQAGPVAGPWRGEIRVAGITIGMRVVFTPRDGGLDAAIDIPQQGAAAIPLRNVRQQDDRVHFELPAGPGLAVFDGARRGDRIEGTFTQAGATGTFVLASGDAPFVEPPAPPPSGYRSEEVTFGHDDIRLAGTLTMPEGEGPWPAVVLISGSGAQSRDEDVAGFKVFGTLADALTRAGIAVLRYDDRGVGGSTGGPATATTADYAKDVLAAVALLAGRSAIRPDGIGLLGHSEGALVAAIAAPESPDVAFVILMAGPAVTGERIVRAQAEGLVRQAGGGDAQLQAVRAQQDRLFRAVRTGQGWDEIESSLRAQGRAQYAALPAARREALGDLEAWLDGLIATQLAGAKSAWYRFFLDYDPAPAMATLQVPVLAVFGRKDIQVPLDQNRPALEPLFTGARRSLLTVRIYDEANHLFQPSATGAVAEYATLPKAFVPDFTTDVATWILSRAR